jgi:hypothetical protein
VAKGTLQMSDGALNVPITDKSPPMDDGGLRLVQLRSLFVPRRRTLACGLVAPAHEVAGDTFDVAANDHHFDVALNASRGCGKNTPRPAGRLR